MNIFENIRFLMNNLMDCIYEREMYMNQRSFYIE